MKELKVHLRPSKKAKGIRNNLIGVFDIETWGLEPKAFAIGVVMWKVNSQYIKTRFKEPKKMFLFMTSYIFRGYTWWGHNVEYDLLGICENPLTEFDKCIYAKSNFILAIKKIGKNTIRFQDSANLFKTSLKNIGKAMGYKKYDTPDKFTLGLRSKITKKDWVYCERDCEIVFKAVVKFKDWIFKYYDCNIGCTIASTALKVWKTNWGIDLYVDDYVNEEFRKSYYGGRTEVFIKGHVETPMNYYDINSLYSSVYGSIKYPDPSRMKIGNGLKEFRKVIKNERYEGTAYIELYTENEIPILPVRIEGKLVFPKGSIKGNYNFNEIRFALSNGYRIINVGRFIYSPFIDSPFAGYVRDIYSKRLEYQSAGDEMGETFCKYLLNSLYGKFGEMRDNSEWGEWCYPIPGKYFEEVRDGWGYWKEPGVTEIRTEHTVFAFCSYVTSAARIELYKLMQKVEQKNGEIYYCDTDSIITDITLPTSLDLGDIKLEGICVDGYILKPKQYELTFADGSILRKMKGIPKRCMPDTLFARSIPVLRYVKSKEALRRDLRAGVKLTVIKRNNYAEGDKRIFDLDGVDLEVSCVKSKPICLA